MHWLESIKSISAGLPVTLSLAFASTLVGILLALGVLLIQEVGTLKVIANFFVWIFTSTPLVLQLFFIYYGFGELFKGLDYHAHSNILFKILRAPYFYAFLTLTLNTGAYLSELMRSSFLAVDKGQIEAAKVLGFNRWQIFKRIIVPQGLAYFLPGFSNELILLVKGTALVSVITVLDITGYMQLVFAQNYSFLAPFGVASLYYLLINSTIAFVLCLLERKTQKWQL